MPLVINTNSAATVAANYLASSNQRLQRSLNRLSSGSKIVQPQDDAAGLAVSMKLSASIRRQSAVSANLENATSYLQTQDGVLQVAGKILSRIGELKTLSSDVTKNSSDRANYQAEFAQLQAQLNALASERFNGVSLFGAATLSVAATEDGTTVIPLAGVDLFGTSGSASVSIDFSGGTTQTFSPPSAGTLTFNGTSLQFLDFTETGGSILSGGQSVFYDGAGTWNFSALGGIDMVGYSTVALEASDTNTTASFTPTGDSSVSSVASASSLEGVDVSQLADATAQIAGNRASNGANQSRLQFASELIAVNRANLEAANSRIADVDVAAESTVLARDNVLVNSGTAMLTQANQFTQFALKLLT